MIVVNSQLPFQYYKIYPITQGQILIIQDFAM